MNRRNRVLLAVGCAGSVAAAAIVSGVTGRAGSEPVAVKSIEPRTGGVTSTPTERAVPADVGELEKAVPGLGQDLVLDGKTFYEESVLRERLIQSCMAQLGFRYELSSPLINPAGSELSAADDPNRAIVEGLLAGDFTAYSRALGGVADVYAEDLPPKDEWLDGGGCIGKAHASVPGLYRVSPALTRGAEEIREQIVDAAPPTCEGPDGQAMSPDELQAAVDAKAFTLEEKMAAMGTCRGPAGLEEKVQAALRDYVKAHGREVAVHVARLEADSNAAEAALSR